MFARDDLEMSSCNMWIKYSLIESLNLGEIRKIIFIWLFVLSRIMLAISARTQR